LNNFHLKILSLMVAFLLWLNITSTQKTRFEFFAEIKVLNVPKKIKIERVEPEKVLVVIEGVRSKLNQVNISKIKVYADGRKLRLYLIKSMSMQNQNDKIFPAKKPEVTDDKFGY